MSDALSTALAGVRVVALATNIPGPLASARLRALGASVVKVEPLAGDPLELASKSWYAAIVQGMDVRRLNARDAGDRNVLHDLVRNADVLLSAMRSSALERMGLGWNELHAAMPGVVHIAVVGEREPHADRAGHDLTYQARAGLLAPPAMPRSLVGDLAAAERAVSATLAALLVREKTGEGTRVEIAIVDAAESFAAPRRFGLTGEGDVLGGGLDTYAMYPAKDGWIAVAALEEHFAHRLRAHLGIEALVARELRTAFAQRTMDEWEELAAQADLPLAAIRDERRN